MKKEMASLFKALAEENRLTIIERLLHGETCGCTIIDKLSITQPTMSYHLKILADSKLIHSSKQGTWHHHHVNKEALDKMIDYLTTLRGSMVD